MDEELAAFLNQRLEETRRHFDVVAEGLRGEIRVVAEGHLGLGRQLQELRQENELAHREILSAIISEASTPRTWAVTGRFEAKLR